MVFDKKVICYNQASYRSNLRYMKKTKYFFAWMLALSFAFLPLKTASAASLGSTFPTVMQLQEIRDFSPLTIEADEEEEITAEHGINLILDPDMWILWHTEATPKFTGEAVENGRVSANAEVTYSSDYKVVHIPVKKDFLPEEKLEIDLLQARTYQYDFSDRYLGMDLNGDLEVDVLDLNHYEVEDIDNTDFINPYPVSGAQHELNEEGELILTWDALADYDVDYVRIDKTLVTNGEDKSFPKAYSGYKNEFTDTQITDEADSVTYEIYVVDFVGNVSPTVEYTVELKPSEPKVIEEAVEEESLDESNEVIDVEETEEITPTASCQNPFLDIDNQPQKEYIIHLYCEDVLSGKRERLFFPSEVSTRAEFLKMAMGINGYPEKVMADIGEKYLFGDISADEWHAPYIALARQEGIVVGYEGDEFRPNQGITQAEALKLLLLTSGAEVSEVDGDDPWYKNYLAYAQQEGILSNFDPNQPLTRAQAAEIISKTLTSGMVEWLK